MPQVVNTNIMALNVQRNLNRSQEAMQLSLQRLSSGLRINSARDDPAGLAISERFVAQIKGLNQAARNASDAVSLAQTAEGALTEISTNLQRMRELAVEAANASVSTSDRNSLNQEYAALVLEIGRVASATTFNGIQVIGQATTLVFQVGANAGAANQLNLSTVNATTAGGVASVGAVTISGVDGTNATATITVVDLAIDSISGIRADYGSLQNRFESVIRGLETSSINLSAANSRIRDADFAAETAELARAQILQQAGIAALVQANAFPQNVLSLLDDS